MIDIKNVIRALNLVIIFMARTSPDSDGDYSKSINGQGKKKERNLPFVITDCKMRAERIFCLAQNCSEKKKSLENRCGKSRSVLASARSQNEEVAEIWK